MRVSQLAICTVSVLAAHDVSQRALAQDAPISEPYPASPEASAAREEMPMTVAAIATPEAPIVPVLESASVTLAPQVNDALVAYENVVIQDTIVQATAASPAHKAQLVPLPPVHASVEDLEEQYIQSTLQARLADDRYAALLASVPVQTVAQATASVQAEDFPTPTMTAQQGRAYALRKATRQAVRVPDLAPRNPNNSGPTVVETIAEGYVVPTSPSTRVTAMSKVPTRSKETLRPETAVTIPVPQPSDRRSSPLQRPGNVVILPGPSSHPSTQPQPPAPSASDRIAPMPIRPIAVRPTLGRGGNYPSATIEEVARQREAYSRGLKAWADRVRQCMSTGVCEAKP